MAIAQFSKFDKQVFALMRIVFGFLLAFHGAQKILGMFGGSGGSGEGVELLSLMGVAGIIELLGGLMIALGLFSSYVAFIASGEMAAGYFIVHFPRGFWPIQNGGELAVLYCFAFLFIAVKGPGIWALNKN